MNLPDLSLANQEWLLYCLLHSSQHLGPYVCSQLYKNKDCHKMLKFTNPKVSEMFVWQEYIRRQLEEEQRHLEILQQQLLQEQAMLLVRVQWSGAVANKLEGQLCSSTAAQAVQTISCFGEGNRIDRHSYIYALFEGAVLRTSRKFHLEAGVKFGENINKDASQPLDTPANEGTKHD